MVWPPDRATVSVGSRFLVAKEVSMVLALDVGAGRLANVAALVAKVRPSRRPSGTG